MLGSEVLLKKSFTIFFQTFFSPSSPISWHHHQDYSELFLYCDQYTNNAAPLLDYELFKPCTKYYIYN